MGVFGDQVWLFQTDLDDGTRTFFDPLDGRIEERVVPGMLGFFLMGVFGEWVILGDVDTKECFLLNLSSQSKINLPPMSERFEFLAMCNLSSCPTSPDCTIIFVGDQGEYILFCRACSKEWTKVPIERIWHERPSSVIWNGKLYVASRDDIIVIDVASLFTSNVDITKIRAREISSECSYILNLVESCGDLYLMDTILATNDGVIKDVKIYRLLLEEDCWDPVESIGDRAFFFGYNNMDLLCPDGCGIERDCIYYVYKCFDRERLYKISLIDQTIGYKLIPPEAADMFLWVVPTRSQSIEHKMSASLSSIDLNADAQVIEQEEDRSTNDVSISRPWADLPIELLDSLSKHFSLNDFWRIPAVCKPWRLLSNPIKDAKVWLMYGLKADGTCNFFDPFKGHRYTANIEEALYDDHIRLRFSRDGWVVVSFGDDGLALIKPFTKETIELPLGDYRYCSIAFSSVPTSPDFVLLAVYTDHTHKLVVETYRRREDGWCFVEFDTDPQFYARSCPPVFFCGEFYFLGNKGGLGVFNPEKKMWRVLGKLRPIHVNEPEMGTEYCYLVESRGELIAIFRGIATPYVHVFKLDRSKMKWVRLKDLGDVAIFAAGVTSFAMTSTDRRCKNKIHFEGLHDGLNNDKGEFYCMATQKYTSGFESLRAPLSCVWLEPKLEV